MTVYNFCKIESHLLQRDQNKIDLALSYIHSVMRSHKRREVFKRSALTGFEYAIELSSAFTIHEREELKGFLSNFNWEIEIETDKDRHLTIVIKV